MQFKSVPIDWESHLHCWYHEVDSREEYYQSWGSFIFYLIIIRVLKDKECHTDLTVPFVASHWISGLKEERTEHLLPGVDLIPFLSLPAKHQCLLSYLKGTGWSWFCSYCLLRKSSHQANWTFAWASVAGFGPYASQLLYLHSAEYAYSRVPIKQTYIQ